MRGSFRLEPVATWINQPILVRLVSSDLREFIRSWSCFTPGVWSFARSEVVLRKNGWNRASGQTYAIRLLEWGLFIKGRGCLKRHLLYSKFCVRIYSGDGSGQFIRRKFSTQRVVFKLREGLGLPANKRCLFQTRLYFQIKFSFQRDINRHKKRSQSCSWRSRSPISTHVWRSKCSRLREAYTPTAN